MPARDPSVARFVARHAVSRREEALADVAPYVDMTLEERMTHLRAACRLAAQLVAARGEPPPDPEPPSPGWTQLVRRSRRV